VAQRRTKNRRQADKMFKWIFKWLFILGVFAFLALVAYAYVGPYLGADFSAPTTEVRQKVILDGQ